MIQRFKNAASVFVMTATLATSTLAFTAPQANAGLILMFGSNTRTGVEVGEIVAVVGLLTFDPFLLLLGEDGNIGADQLTAKIAASYPQLDRLSAGDLSAAISERARTLRADDTGKKVINLSRDEVSQALQASNIEFAQPELFNQIANSLK